MNQKYAIFKICPKFAQNLPENNILVKQVSISTFLGIVRDKKWSPFLDLGVRSPIFLHRKSLEMAAFMCKKSDFGHSSHSSA